MNSTLDVALRLRMHYQGRDADKAERDIKDLDEAAKRLGRSKGGDALAQDLRTIGRDADDARQKLGRVGDGLNGLKGEAREAATAIRGIKTEAAETRSALGRIDDGAFAGLKRDAHAAKQAITEIGQAADRAEQKVRGLRAGGGHQAYTTGGRLPPGRMGSGFMNMAEGAVDQFGLPIALGAGTAYLAGALPAGAGVIAGAAVNAAAKDEFTLDQIQNTGGFNDEEKRRYDAMLGKVGPKHGIGKQGAMQVFGALQAGGLEHGDAAAMMDDVVRFAKSTGSDVGDAANTATALRNNMGIAPKDLLSVFDAMTVGGNSGRFEVPDMARNFPSMLAAMAVQGSTGSRGVNLATAMAQSIMKSSGSADQAKTSFEAMLRDMMAPEVTGRAKKDYGVDASAVKAAAVKAGDDPVLALIKAYQGAVGGDESKMRDLFRNDESFKGLAAVFRDMKEVEALMRQMEASKGTTEAGYENATGNFSSQKDRLTSNVGQNIKDMAAPLLPILTGMMRHISENIEKAREAPEKDPIASVPGTALATEGMKLILQGTSSKGDQPSPLQRFLFGKGADKDFNLREHMGVDLRSTAQTSMDGYNEALTAEGAKAEGIASSIAESIKTMFGFTVSPTIQPTYVAPTGGGAAATTGQQHTSVSPTSNRFNQTIVSPNSMHAARQSRREIQKAQARTLYDTGRRLA